MGAEWYGGVPWAPTVLAKAQERGCAAEVSAIALRYRSREGGHHVVPNPHPRGGLIVSTGRYAAVLSSLDVVVGFRVHTAEDVAEARLAIEEAKRAQRGPGIARAKGGGAGNLNPTSFSELITMLKAEGYSVEMGGKHMAVLRDGAVIATIPVTASDHRSLLNAVTLLRRETGAELRRGARTTKEEEQDG